MDATPSYSSAEAYLAWFQQHKAPQYRAYLCSRYGLNALDADAFLNEAYYVLDRHWVTVESPCAFLATTLRRLGARHCVHRQKEQAMLHEYTEAVLHDMQHQAEVTAHVAAMLEGVSPRERHLLQQFLHGVEDRETAAGQGIARATVRWQRAQVYEELRQQYAA
jgi:DNA-directed RNA polymerase specialized sigma24 family protein